MVTWRREGFWKLQEESFLLQLAQDEKGALILFKVIKNEDGVNV